jgi:hypothetical protein
MGNDMMVRTSNEQPRSKPRGLKDRSPQDLRSQPRFPHLLSMEKAGQAAGYSNPVPGPRFARAGFSAEGKRKRDKDDLTRLTYTVENFCRWIESLPARDLRPQRWGPREVLAHLAYWHEQYSAQSQSALSGKAFPLSAGRFSDLNDRAVEKFCTLAPAVLVRRFRAANRRLCLLARSNDPHKIAFRIKQDSRLWKLSDLIPAAEGHVRNHFQKLKK